MINIDYSLKPSTVQKDRSAFDVRSLDEIGLRRISRGRIFIFDDKQRAYFVIESQVLDYAKQLAGVIFEFDRGNRETFAVSPDFFSNNLRFRLEQQSGEMEIYDVNGGNFCFNFKYKQFKDAIQRFCAGIREEFQSYYPELKDNTAFLRLFTR
jgi:hypothetical protein